MRFVGCRIPARGWRFSGVRRVVFGLGEVDGSMWWLWRWRMRAGGNGGPLLSLATSGGRRWTLDDASGPEREGEQRVRFRERERCRASGLQAPDLEPPFPIFIFSFFWAQLTSFN